MAKLRSKKEKNISPEEAEKIKGIKRDKLGMILKGSTALNEKYDKERAIGIFTDLTHRCIAGEFLSMQEAQMLSGVAHDTFYSLVKRFPEVAALKAQMNSAIVAKIYRGAMEGDLAAAPAIFGMKNLGEKDRTTIEQEVVEQPLFSLPKGNSKKIKKIE